MRALDGSIDELIGFLRDWHGEPEPTYGVPESELPAGLPDVALTPTLEHLLTSFALQESLFGSRFLASVDAGDAWAAEWAGAEPLWENGWYVLEEPSHSFRRRGPFLLAEIAGDGWIGWNDADARLSEPLVTAARMIHAPE